MGKIQKVQWTEFRVLKVKLRKKDIIYIHHLNFSCVWGLLRRNIKRPKAGTKMYKIKKLQKTKEKDNQVTEFDPFINGGNNNQNIF